MRVPIILSVVALGACVDPLPVGTGGVFGPVQGAAPPAAAGPGPFLTGGTGIGTAVASPAPLVPYPETLPGFMRRGSNTYVGGQEGVVAHVVSHADLEQRGPSASEIYGGRQNESGCLDVFDIYGRAFRLCG